ncbi:MAG: helix-turn-helix domain-containing protein [Pseudomonadota bacterium]
MNLHANPALAPPAAIPAGLARFAVPPPTRERILAAARSLLRTHGYASFTMEGVALECGLTRRTLYNQFADRDALYQASRAALLAAFEGGLPREIMAVGDPLIAVERFLALAVDALAHPAHVELARSAEVDETAYPWVAELYESCVRAPLREAVERYLHGLGFAGPGVRGRAVDLVAMLGAAVHGTRHAPVFAPSELAEIFLRRLRAAAPALDVRAARW